MSEVICFTSANIAYLDRALVLEASIRRTNPSWRMVLLLVDSVENAQSNALPLSRFDEVIMSSDLLGEEHDGWIFGHDVVEACTAVKGAALLRLLGRNPTAVLYLDPDTCVFSDMTEVMKEAQEYDLCLTPHQLTPALHSKAIEDNEIGSLRHGIFNLGFLIVRPTDEGQRFAQWWADRLHAYCIDDLARGLFTDQKWIDHVPVFFPGSGILRDPGLNVASWNLDGRRVTADDHGAYLVNEAPLYFWHFTKAESDGPLMTMRYGPRDAAVVEAWRYYRERLVEERSLVTLLPWPFDAFSDGTPIPLAARRIYRQRPDLQRIFPAPFTSGSPSMQEWFFTTHSVGQ